MSLVMMHTPAPIHDLALTAANDYLHEPISAAWIPAQPSLSPGIPVYGVQFEAALAARGLDRDHLVPLGWRFFVLEGDVGVSAALHVLERDGSGIVTHISHDPSVTVTLDSLARIEDEAGDEDTDVCIVSAPELFFETVLAFGRERVQAAVVVTQVSRQAPPGLMSIGEANELLRSLAVERISREDAPTPIVEDEDK